jgi:hypothetical protein
MGNSGWWTCQVPPTFSGFAASNSKDLKVSVPATNVTDSKSRRSKDSIRKERAPKRRIAPMPWAIMLLLDSQVPKSFYEARPTQGSVGA